MQKTVRIVSFSAAAFFSASALAQEPANTRENVATSTVVDAHLNYIYDASSAAKFPGAQRANSDASALNLGVNTRVRLNDDWFVPFGLQSENYFLGPVAGEPIPEDIHTLHLHIGLGWRMNDEWTFTGVAGPALYRFDDLHSDDLGAYGAFMAAYRPSAAYTWTFGVIIAPDNDVPVLPVVGLRWQINDRYNLEVGAPKTRLTYHIDPQWSLYTGLDMSGTTFRTSENLGTHAGNPRYNNALATYRDIRLGVGAGFEVVHGLRAEIEAGYSIYHRITFKDYDQEVEFDPAPYVRAGLSYRF